MNERERIIDAFRNCITIPKCKDCSWTECSVMNNPLVEIPTDLALAVMRELMAQEPRVMTLEEVKQWCETHSHKQNPIWVEFKHGYGIDGWRVGLVNSGMLAWCKDNEARCWTSRPDEKRRTETPWE